jgi:hypothetical protein
MSSKSHALYLNLLSDLDWALDPGEYEQALNSELVLSPPSHIQCGSAVQRIAARSLINAFFKKNIDEISPSADQAALSKFLSANICCGNYQGISRSGDESWNYELIGEFKRRVHEFFQPLAEVSLGAIFDRGRLGSGSNLLANGTDFYTKMFSSPLSVTNLDLYHAFKAWINESDRHRAANDLRSTVFGECSLVEGNRLSFVPKTRNISRTICTEPTVNMYAQLGLGALIEDRLREVYKIDLSTQPVVQKLMAGRLSESGEPVFATIDLASASDTISLRLLSDILPRAFLGYLKLFRSPLTTLPGGETVQLEMISSMGNGFTFPLQTAIFSCLVHSVYSCRDRRLIRNRLSVSGNDVLLRYANFGVFGDDIIVANDLFADTCYLLERCGFVVNEQKSFNKGVFRESCGSDYWCGQNVRGVYVKSLLTTQLRYSLINRLTRWSAEHRISLDETLQFLLDSVPLLYVPAWESDDSGIRVPRRFAQSLVRDKHIQSVKYRRWTSEVPRLEFMDGCVRTPPGEKVRHFNENGAVLCLLKGSLGSDGVLGVRPKVKRYRMRTSVAPNWDNLTKLSEQERLSFIVWSGYCHDYIMTNVERRANKVDHARIGSVPSNRIGPMKHRPERLKGRYKKR